MADTSWLGLENKVIVVTGGASGIGKHIAQTLNDAGAQVVVGDLNAETGTRDSSGIYYVQLDVTKKESVEHLTEHVVKEFGSIDGLVNNAGINLPRLLVDFKGEKPEYELDEKAFDLMVNVNQKGLFLMTQAVVRKFLKQGKGVVVNIASEAGMEGSQGQSCYSATKAAVNGFTRSWAKELGSHHIRVVAVAPGINEKTGLTTDAYNEALAYTRNITVDQLGTDYSKAIPLGRPGKLDDIGNLVTYLLSERADYITGTTVNITGGKSRG
ncbi:SDR family oxidoreductase [Sporolactobacillus inulinus]|jgi:sorbitol-6-phosphate 2-dehydrogenase|uniref:Sorbitol-6-phosphate 2-dehydrogenase n=1 Tax=Sporolactobacillus inulinus CASD TaxID=1069536 RepID=A0A0U1QRK8_9BACL|nr:SDR family oxidoreductase [Sporolactobacillus inulinus]KLI03450.1 sorbitol-6-phosphate 2-dehydrogenase [Sporolactobacillus inulinus CASD]GEB77435.1 sorbitol-6-phosphate 2-dehydrogenase [Sporolactobacillus inulinus]